MIHKKKHAAAPFGFVSNGVFFPRNLRSPRNPPRVAQWCYVSSPMRYVPAMYRHGAPTPARVEKFLKDARHLLLKKWKNGKRRSTLHPQNPT